jgi:hypothetical protein
MNSQHKILDEIKGHVDRLKSLLDHPVAASNIPDSFSWAASVGEEMRWLSDFCLMNKRLVISLFDELNN